jgi:LPPG:FO 2-phospho-L-lactate transferase
VSPVIGGSVVRGMAHRLLPLLGAEVSAAGVGSLYGARRDAAGRPTGGLLDGWLVDDVDAEASARLSAIGLRTVARPLLMADRAAAASLAGAALDLALAIGPRVDPAAGSR